jgi:hypothetical protein
MILVYAIIFLMGLALVLRQDLRAIGELPYRGGWKLGGSVAGLFLLQATLVMYLPGQTTFQMLIVVLSQLGLIVLFLFNYHIPGAGVFALGVILNTTVMIANGGWMPITPETYNSLRPGHEVELQDRAPASKGIMLSRDETKLWLLSDIIRVDLGWHRSAMSVGDLLLILGVAQFLFQAPTLVEKRLPELSRS